MNTITLIVTILTLWLVMGLGFLSAYAEVKRKRRPVVEAWTSYEGLLFIVSVLVPVILGLYRVVVN